MQSLLRWSIENSEPGATPPQPMERGKLDPELMNMILGKPDAELMKEALAIAVDETRDEDVRVQALDNFEMLIENIDNANDLVKLRMWESIHGLLTSPSSTDEIKRRTLWIIGTAVQNNPSAQSAYLTLSPMQTLLSFLAPSAKPPQTRSKAVYALSSLLNHCVPAVQQLQEANGWEVLRNALQDPDIVVRRKTAFLMNALLMPATPNVQPPPSRAPQPTGQTAVVPHPPSEQTSVVPHPQLLEQSSATVHPAHNVHHPDSQQAPVHPNSHSSMAADPSSFSTSSMAQRALEDYGLLQSCLDALIVPVPFGPDGEKERDKEFEDKTVSVLYTYAMSCYGSLSLEQKKALSGYLQKRANEEGSEHALAERLGLSTDELKFFKRVTDE